MHLLLEGNMTPNLPLTALRHSQETILLEIFPMSDVLNHDRRSAERRETDRRCGPRRTLDGGWVRAAGLDKRGVDRRCGDRRNADRRVRD